MKKPKTRQGLIKTCLLLATGTSVLFTFSSCADTIIALDREQRRVNKEEARLAALNAKKGKIPVTTLTPTTPRVPTTPPVRTGALTERQKYKLQFDAADFRRDGFLDMDEGFKLAKSMGEDPIPWWNDALDSDFNGDDRITLTEIYAAEGL